MSATTGSDEAGAGAIAVVDLSEGATSAIGAILRGLFLLVIAVLWLAIMITAAAAPTTHPRDRPIVLLLALVAVAPALWGLRMCRSAVGRRARLEVTDEELVLVYPAILSEPLRLRRDDVLALAIDEGIDRRFAVVDGDPAADQIDRRVVGHLWARGTGGQLPLLSLRRTVPDCAILFSSARTLPLVSRVRANHPAPSRRPLPDRLEAGLMLCTGDGERLRAVLAAWSDGLVVHRQRLVQAATPARRLPVLAGAGRADPLASVGPAPLRTRAPSRRLASIRIIAVLAALGVGAGALTVFSGFVIASTLAGRLPTLAGLFAAAIILCLAWVLTPRARAGGDVGERVSPTLQPELWRLIRDAADAIGVRTPDEVRITLWPAVSLSQRLRMTARPHTVLRIGLPALALLDETQLRALVAATLDARRGHSALLINWAWRAQHPLQRTIRRRRLPLVAALAMRGLTRVLRPVTRMLIRDARALTDAVWLEGVERVAQLVPTPVLDEATAAVALAQEKWDAYWREVVLPGLRDHEPPALVLGFREWLEVDMSNASILVTELPSLEDRLLTVGR